MPTIIEHDGTKVVTGLMDVNGTTPVVLCTAEPKDFKFVIKKLLIYNKDTAPHEVILGEYDASNGTWVKDKLIFKVGNGAVLGLTKEELPADFVIATDETSTVAWAVKLDADVSANPVKVKAEFQIE